MYGNGSHLGDVTKIPTQSYLPLTHGYSTCNLSSGLEKTMLENNDHIHESSPGPDQTILLSMS